MLKKAPVGRPEYEDLEAEVISLKKRVRKLERPVHDLISAQRNPAEFPQEELYNGLTISNLSTMQWQYSCRLCFQWSTFLATVSGKAANTKRDVKPAYDRRRYEVLLNLCQEIFPQLTSRK